MKALTPWRRLLAASAAIAIFVLAGSYAPLAAAAKPPSGGGGKNSAGPCPSPGALEDFLTASNVGAGYTNTGTQTLYRFFSLLDENPTGGIPGLIRYCVYPPASATVHPEAINVTATVNGHKWVSRKGSTNFSFERWDGDRSNIPLNVATTEMGTVDWSGTAPSDQIILLHIADPTVCAALYGVSSVYDVAGTCFVKPSPPTSWCNQGDPTVAYNANSYGAELCVRYSRGFEAWANNEFGDEVQLATGTGRQLVSLNVVFSSFACSESGSWNGPVQCVTNAGATFTHSITANIYSVKTTGCPAGTTSCRDQLLATHSGTYTIPYRPSADPVSCPATPTKFFNPLIPNSDGTFGSCKNALSKVLTFTDWKDSAGNPYTGQLPDTVIWTVAFNTTHSGYNPIGSPGVNNCVGSPAGCPYDSLNVGTDSFTGAPYAGVDINEDVAFESWWQNTLTGNRDYPQDPNVVLKELQSTTGWTSYRPLGEIITTP